MRRCNGWGEDDQHYLLPGAAGGLRMLAHGGTISHQHGVGLDHRAYLAAQKGEIGLAALAALRQAPDPDERLNPGKLIPPKAARIVRGGGPGA
jgi:FAD/FMN-containing dehydrogenase